MKKMRSILSVLLVLLAVPFVYGYLQFPAVLQLMLDLPAFTAKAGEVRTLQVSMRDGVELETHIFFPQGDGSWPTILIRDPYGFADFMNCPLFVRYGYICVHQDTRGKGGSGGEWQPLVNERADGLDTLAWLTVQPWQNGNIALFGGSYLGMVQWAMMDALPPEVKTAIADVSHGDFYALNYRRGSFIHGIMSHWVLSQGYDIGDLSELAMHRPALENGRRYFASEQPWYNDYLEHPSRSSAYWQASGFAVPRDSWKGVRIPLLMMGSWNDFFLEGQLRTFARLPTANRSLMTVRQGAHAWPSGTGDLDVATLQLGRFELHTQLGWLDYHLKGNTAAKIQTGYLLQDNIDGRVEHYAQWPAATRDMQLHLADLRGAGQCDGGDLQAEAPALDATVSYRYDPDDPVPSRGGNYILSPFHPSVVDQKSELCARDDVLSFGSEVFDGGLHIQGAVRVRLQVASSANDTAFTVKLQEKRADGRVLNIRDDIVTLRYRHSDMSPADYTASAVVEVDFELIPVDWKMAPGSSLRLDVSSSNFPVFAPHTNSTVPWHQARVANIAQQTLYGGVLTLPIASEPGRVL
jgi:putative CocE/NonD family hydrolase